MSAPPVQIGRFHWTDIPAAVAIEQECFTADRWKAETFWRELARTSEAMYFAARSDDALVGYAGVVNDGVDAHLHTIAIAPSARGRGYGSQLLSVAIEAAWQAGTSRMLLEVSEHNATALAMYGGHGFVELARREDYYAPGDAAVVMELVRSDG